MFHRQRQSDVLPVLKDESYGKEEQKDGDKQGGNEYVSPRLSHTEILSHKTCRKYVPRCFASFHSSGSGFS